MEMTSHERPRLFRDRREAASILRFRGDASFGLAQGAARGRQALFLQNHDELCEALWKDLRRNVVDADLMDVDYNVKEADYALKHLDAWTTDELVHTPLVFQPGHVRIRRDPLGVTLIISAWNEPLMLLFAPLVAAFAAGNTAVLKPSEIATACSAAAARLVPKYFDPRAATVIEGACRRRPPFSRRSGI